MRWARSAQDKRLMTLANLADKREEIPFFAGQVAFMKSRMIRFGLSFIVGLGFWLGKVHAQEAPAVVSSTAPEASAPAGTVYAEPAPNGTSASGRPAHDFLHRHGYLCGQCLDCYGCGGWRQFTTFAFGSCRTFFGEPCLQRQPPDGPGYGYGNGPGNGNGYANGRGSCPGGCR
jgi:hypothetical protein